MKYSIKATHLDTINNIGYYQKRLLLTPKTTKTEERELRHLDKETLIELLQKTDNYYFEEGCICYTRDITEQEIQEEQDRVNKSIEYETSRLIKWCENSAESKEQIMGYLQRNDIIIEGLTDAPLIDVKG